MLLSSSRMLVRAARPDDYRMFARLHPELRTPDAVPDEAWFRREMLATMLVAERDGSSEGVGIGYYQVLKGIGFLRMLITDPAVRRAGVGRALMDAVRARFTQSGCTEMCLNVLPTNAAAIALYESYGLRRAYGSKVLGFPWGLLDRAPAGRGEVHPIEPADDPRVERDTGMLPGLLADVRRKGGRLFGKIEETGSIVAAAIFDPNFPGAYPFRAWTLDHAVALLRAFRPHARPGDAALGLVLEDLPDVADALLALGATLRLETMHMRGKIEPG